MNKILILDFYYKNKTTFFVIRLILKQKYLKKER